MNRLKQHLRFELPKNRGVEVALMREGDIMLSRSQFGTTEKERVCEIKTDYVRTLELAGEHIRIIRYDLNEGIVCFENQFPSRFLERESPIARVYLKKAGVEG